MAGMVAKIFEHPFDLGESLFQSHLNHHVSFGSSKESEREQGTNRETGHEGANADNTSQGPITIPTDRPAIIIQRSIRLFQTDIPERRSQGFISSK
jgi:hypothetical protein